MKLKELLANLITDFGKNPYKDASLEESKKHIINALNNLKTSGVEKALVISLKSKIEKTNDKTKILFLLSEKMFALSGEGV